MNILKKNSRYSERATLTNKWQQEKVPGSRVQAQLDSFISFLRSLWRNPLAVVGLGIVVMLLVTALLGPVFSPHDPVAQNLAVRLQGPSATYWFGTDELGRDISHGFSMDPASL